MYLQLATYNQFRDRLLILYVAISVAEGTHPLSKPLPGFLQVKLHDRKSLHIPGPDKQHIFSSAIL